ncbi:helix-turn-helix domain-containing protein [Streptomyces mirabilis]|jgi:DNA-binding Xre family transcriptional regulator|uniref:DNA-binding transcriptional regulator, XRE family n=1 Tax=Streptomyces mirabilis TaxID=68239 RepID=A0A1I2SFF2_9ACTN|nr:DNA-binding transcriptional regulator, XRE family [Streptomyces mirabilis]
MRWNLRLAAANRGIWKAGELQRMLAERGLVISAGKMSGLWSGQPISVKLADLDVICAVLGCGIDELLVPEPETATAPTLRPSATSSLRADARSHTAGAEGPVPAAAVTALSTPAGSCRCVNWDAWWSVRPCRRSSRASGSCSSPSRSGPVAPGLTLAIRRLSLPSR